MIKFYFDDIIPNHIYSIVYHFNYKLTSIHDCDYIISCKFYAETTNNIKTIQNNLDSYQNVNKKVIVFLICDFADNLHIPYNVILFRTSMYKSQKKFNEFLLPYVWEDIDTVVEPLDRSNSELPIVGFCGRVDMYREKLVNALQNSNQVKCNFILRKDFWGGDPHNPNLFTEFINNIISSHFTVSNRGNGNYSMRFYQVLSAGRIPILTDSDLIFPFDDEIPWHNIAIIGKNEEDVINKISEWWRSKDIIIIQKKCKEIYNNFFDRRVFLQKIFDNIINKYVIPMNFEPNIYNKYFDLKGMNCHQLLIHYIKNGKNENRIINLPENFDFNKYQKNYSDLINLNYEQLISHYVNFCVKENRKYI
jgi:hypothetical protein